MLSVIVLHYLFYAFQQLHLGPILHTTLRVRCHIHDGFYNGPIPLDFCSQTAVNDLKNLSDKFNSNPRHSLQILAVACSTADMYVLLQILSPHEMNQMMRTWLYVLSQGAQAMFLYFLYKKSKIKLIPSVYLCQSFIMPLQWFFK
jgi:hypothetical protein